MNQVKVKYTGATPGADSNVYELFSTHTLGAGAAFPAMTGLSRLTVAIKNAASGTLKLYKSQDRSGTSNPSSITTWTQVAEHAVAAAAATAENVYDYLVEPYYDTRLTWTNGGSAQTTWLVDMSLTPERSPAA